jgi:hypothetical protein
VFNRDAADGVLGAELGYRVHALDHTTEHAVVAVKVKCRLKADVELAGRGLRRVLYFSIGALKQPLLTTIASPLPSVATKENLPWMNSSVTLVMLILPLPPFSSVP